MKRTGNLSFYSIFHIQLDALFFFPPLRLNPLCSAVQISIGETMVTNNLLCFNEKYVSWWETKPGINTEGTLNNGPRAGVCPKLCCSFLLTAIHPRPWVTVSTISIKKRKKNQSIRWLRSQNMYQSDSLSDSLPKQMYNTVGKLHRHSQPYKTLRLTCVRLPYHDIYSNTKKKRLQRIYVCKKWFEAWHRRCCQKQENKWNK